MPSQTTPEHALGAARRRWRSRAAEAAFAVFSLAPAAIATALASDRGSTDAVSEPHPAPLTTKIERSAGPPAEERSSPLDVVPARTRDGARGLRIRWRRSLALGLPHAGRLERGVRVPQGGPFFFTWDPVFKTVPNRRWRLWGTDLLVRRTLRVLREFATAHPRAPRIGIGDLSRPHGGDFSARYGSIGHASHQNGLDVDVYYPRLDRRERSARTPQQVDLLLSQDLVDRFVGAGAEKVFVGPRVGLSGPRRVVMALEHHDNHLHVRFPNRRRRDR